MSTEAGSSRARRLTETLVAIEGLDLAKTVEPRGVVLEVGDGVAHVAGLAGVGYEHMVLFDCGARGMAYDLTRDRTGVVLLADADRVRAGEGCQVFRRLPSVQASPDVLGRVIDPLGNPLDDGPALRGEASPVFRPAPELTERASVRRPLWTGILVVDAAIPIGRGQRQLIIGDRNVGKTALALDIVAAQRTTGVLCVYVVIGQPISRVLAIRDSLAQASSLAHTVVVAADAADSPGLQYLAPYAGMSIAELFADRGRDVVIVFDDLTKHADAYRELALLLERPPGREAYPGDIFYVHAELLERATALSESRGGGSITALPIVESTDSDISAYIPTNLISITDGQIYLDTLRFERNLRPAVDVGRSVSRIGGAAQSSIMRSAARNVRIDTARFESLESLTRVGLDVDSQTSKTLERGRVLRELFRQPRFSRRAPSEQIFALEAVARGWLDGLDPGEARQALTRASGQARDQAKEVVAAMDEGRDPPSDWSQQLRRLLPKKIEGPT